MSKEICAKCGGKIDEVFGLCIGECKQLKGAIPKQKETEDDIYDEIEGVFEVYLNWEMFRDNLKQKFIITKR